MLQRMFIPNSDLRCSRVAFGTSLAGVKYDTYEASTLLNHYVELGGNLIDTARVYNDWVAGEKGRSERVIGEWLRRDKKRNQVILMTKGGHPPLENRQNSRMGKADMEKDLNESLETLGVDTIDIYFYHRDDPSKTVDELLENMEDFRRAGKIQYYACSNWSPERMQLADRYASKKILRGFIANQALFNLGTKHMNPPHDSTLAIMDEKMQVYHERSQRNMAMAYTSNAGGFFHKLMNGQIDEIQNSPYFTEPNIAMAYQLQDLSNKYSASPAQLLMGFILTRRFPCIPIVACSKTEQLNDIFAGLEISFDGRDFDALL